MPLRAPSVRPQAVLVYHINVNGLGPRLEEVSAASAGAAVLSLQDTRLRDAQREAAMLTTWWPAYRTYSFLHDADGPGCALLVRSCLRQRILQRRTVDRQRLIACRGLARGRRIRGHRIPLRDAAVDGQRYRCSAAPGTP